MGVRSSWLTRERNSDLAWLAASARRRASSSSPERTRSDWSVPTNRKPSESSPGGTMPLPGANATELSTAPRSRGPCGAAALASDARTAVTASETLRREPSLRMYVQSRTS